MPSCSAPNAASKRCAQCGMVRCVITQIASISPVMLLRYCCNFVGFIMIASHCYGGHFVKLVKTGLLEV
jgi:hypothetical protein